MPPEKMFVEDLAALESLTEERVLDELNDRTLLGSFHTFIGDVLVILNPNEQQDIYNMTVSVKIFILRKSDLILFNIFFSTIPNTSINHAQTIRPIFIQSLTVLIKTCYITKSLSTFYLLAKVVPEKQQTCCTVSNISCILERFEMSNVIDVMI